HPAGCGVSARSGHPGSLIAPALGGAGRSWGAGTMAGNTVSQGKGRQGMKASGQAVIAWGGDVNLGRRLHYCAASGQGPVLDVPALREADLAIVNLECVVSRIGRLGIRKGEAGPYYFRARPEMLGVLREAGVDVVTTANNHSGDYGPEALMDQERWLAAAGIGAAGAG